MPVLVLWAGLPATAGDDPHALQERAIARIDAYIDHFRRTFDQTALKQERKLAQGELIESIRLFRAAGKPGPAAYSMVKQGDLNRYSNRWDAAIELYEEALRTAQEAGDPVPECMALLGQARSLMLGKRDSDRAAGPIEQAIQIGTGIDDETCLFDALSLRAQTELTQGNLIAAADSLNRAFSVVDRIQNDKLLFYGHLDRADLYQKLAERCDFERAFQPCLEAAGLARRDYEEALALAQGFGWSGLAREVQGFLRRLGTREGLIRSQRRLHQLVTGSAVFAPKQASDVLVNERFTAGENPQLSGLLAWTEAEGGIPPASDARGAFVRGLLREMEGESDEALKWYLRSVELLESDRSLLQTEQARGSFLEDKVEFYYNTMLHLLDRGRLAEAFALMEQASSRVVADLLATKDVAFAEAGQRELYASALTLRTRIAEQQQRLFNLRNATGRMASVGSAGRANAGEAQRGKVLAPSGPSAAELEGELARLEESYQKVMSSIREQAPQLARLISSEPVSLEAVQRMLAADGSELLAYMTLESQLVLWHIGPQSVHVRSVFLPSSELQHKVASLREGLIDPKRPFDQHLARELYLYLVEPVLKWIETDHLVIVPHQDLNYLPFQVLLSSTAPERYLGERYEITYAPSATVLTSLPPPRPVTAGQMLAVADPSLAHAPAEVRAIADRYPGRVEADVLPTEAEVKTWLPGRDLVHFAVHGRFVADQPLLSYLSLRSGGGDDGQLTAAEMYGLPLDAAKLVVLSACETGTAKATHANEVLGMTRGLLFAGADALVLSAWPINDEATAAWMKGFYDGAGFKPPGAAARAAIENLQRDARYRHPYYWGPFLVVGR
ncbi:CHAT domain-containing protein [Thiococcus pfennigii]|uniref:CHAT domain-containing protein n=1 Tax=Thiococcus pfennigii TaxID=1057 RepID=UPI0019034F55